ncbi:MAG: PVC-type heme-binding CxxCH protein, partial [Planctomycetota bacterium]
MRKTDDRRPQEIRFLYRIVLSLLLLALPLSFVSVCAPRAGYGDDFPAIFNNEQDEEAEPLSPDEAVARMELLEGFSVTVFAAEPDVQNPIAMAWDDRGRMWVAENYTYSDKTQRFDLALRDRVLIFADEDNDGRAESRKVFADDVQMLTSVELGRGGVWLMCPPQLLFIPDQDGDDVPDGPPQVVLDGFTVAKSNYHNFANGLRWGPDGWLYGRCGHSCPGRIGTPGTPDARRIPLDGGMWRYHPDRQIVEVLCHGTTNPWGHDWDRHGELFFINTVIGHLWHVNPGSHFKESFGDSLNPAVYERMDMIADHYHFDTTGHWSESRDGKANDLGGGHAHIGMMIYQGERWPQQYRDKLFTLNMHGRRANVERLERRGAGYTALHEPDFLLAGDPFFRGIEIAVGPDRNAFILDWSDTGECHDHTGVHRTSGRIYKISYGHEDASDRMSFAKPLCLAGAGKLPQLWRDYQADAVSPQALRALLRDPDEHVRAWAVRLLVDFWPLDTVVGPLADATYPHDDATHAELLRLAREETSGLVRLTLASTLQRMPSGRRGPLAMELVKDADYANDRDLPLLVWYGLIPLGEHDPAALVDVARQCRWPTTLRAIARYLASRIESHPGPLDALLSTAPSMPEVLQRSVLAGMHDAFRGWRKVPQPASWPALVRSNLAQSEPELMRELRILFGDGRALDEIRHIALDKAAEMSLRRRALKTLIDGRPDDLREVCESLLNVRTLNADAARGLALFDDPAIGRRLARAYHRFHPNDRPVVLETLVSRP